MAPPPAGLTPGFVPNKSFMKHLRSDFGEHYAEAYSSKLKHTYMLLAQKKDNPDLTVSNECFQFEPVNGSNGEQLLSPDEKTIVREFIKPAMLHADRFIPHTEVKMDRFGNIISVKKLKEDGK